MVHQVSEADRVAVRSLGQALIDEVQCRPLEFERKTLSSYLDNYFVWYYFSQSQESRGRSVSRSTIIPSDSLAKSLVMNRIVAFCCCCC